jgi:DNA adenine methylase
MRYNKYNTMEFNKLTKKQLIAICKEKEINHRSNMKKDELIQILSKALPQSNNGAYAKPFLKWVGGKSQIVTNVLEMFPSEFNNYHEPFLGGGSVLIGLLMKQREGAIRIGGNIYASDLNLALISVYQNIQTNPQSVIQALNVLISQYKRAKNGTIVKRDAVTLDDAYTSAESYYYYTRKEYNLLTNKMSASASAMFIFMNKTCFRGVYREGPNGFNVPYGNYSNPGIIDETHILFISDLIQNVIFSHRTYNDAFHDACAGDFVYLDPPYAPETEKSFVSYNAGGFNLADHHGLFNQCLQLSEKNIKFVLSNSDVPIVRTAFLEPTYKTTIISCKRTINSKDPAAKANEVLVRN